MYLMTPYLLLIAMGLFMFFLMGRWAIAFLVVLATGYVIGRFSR